MNEDPTFLINLIEIQSSGQRRARVNHPDSGASVWHGLGDVGEPIRPYLSHRTRETVSQRLPYQGLRLVDVPAHYITLPADASNVVVIRTFARGITPTAATLADLQAGDL